MDLEDLKCGLCSMILEEPITLSCCLNKVCGSHLEILMNWPEFKKSYICDICEILCEKENNPSNLDVLKALELHPRLAINSAKKTIQLIESKKPEYFVYEYFEDRKREIDLRVEELLVIVKKESEFSDSEDYYNHEYGVYESNRELDPEVFSENSIKMYADTMISFLNEDQIGCIELAKAMNPTGQYVDDGIANELKETIRKYDSKIIEANDFELVNRAILKLKFECDKMLSDYYRSVIKGKFRFDLKCFMERTHEGCMFGPWNITDILREEEKKQKRRNWQTKLFDSKILPYYQCKLNYLCGFSFLQKWKLIYRGTRDGFSSEDFHKKCDTFKDTLTLVKSENRSKYNIFGGYTKMEWKSDGTRVLDPDAFVLSLVNPDKMIYKENHRRGILMRYDSAKGPCFGNDFTIESNSNTNEKSHCGSTRKVYCDTYGHDFDIQLATFSNFKTLEIEVFAL